MGRGRPLERILVTNQEAFDRVARHLLTQRARSMDSAGMACAYRGANGLKCAIGCLIPDARYRPSFEERTVGEPEILAAAGLTASQERLAEALQRVHDIWEPDAWSHRLTRLAGEFGLDPAIVQEHGQK